MKSIPGLKILKTYEDRVQTQLPAEIFVTVELDGDTDAYRNSYDSKENAVDSGDHDGELVATYKLVKVEELKLIRSTKIVTTKIPADAE